MAAYTTVDLIVNQKASFQASFTVKTSNGTIVDLTNYTASAKFKRDFIAPDSSAVTFGTEIQAPGTNGVVIVSLTPTQTAAMDVNTKYVWDLTITSNTGLKTRIVQGGIKVSGGVS